MEKGKPILNLDHLSMRFGGLLAVNDFSLTITSGELLGLIGPNGAGKTTIFNMITGYYPPTQGQVIFEGQDITGFPPAKVTLLGIARTFQNIRMCKNMSALDNVLISFHPHLRSSVFGVIFPFFGYNREEQKMRQEGMDLLARVGLTQWANERAGSLPYGLQRQVEIARALATNPRFILLDEPFAGVDPIAVLEIQKIIRFLKERGIGVLITDHNVRETLGICDHAYIINAGNVLAAGRPAEIVENESVRRVYLGEHFKL